MNKKNQHRRKRNKEAKLRSQSFGNYENFEQVNNQSTSENIDDSGPIFDIKTSELMGRYMVSKRQINPGDIILSEEPLVVGPCTGSKVQCLGCYKKLETSVKYVKCPGCGWPLCSHKCPGISQKHGHTVIECAILKESKSSSYLEYNDFEQMRKHFHAIVPLRCLILKTTDPQSFDALMRMESHNEIRRKISDIWGMNQATVVDRLVKDWQLTEFNDNEIHTICGILEVNAFQIGQQGINIRGLYPTAFLMSHDCVPNTNHCDENDFKLTVRASTLISSNQPITMSYAHTLQSTIRRREHLMENKFFACQCNRCSDSSELGSYMSALICPKCHVGLVLSTKPLDPTASWSCSNTDKRGCPSGYTITAKSMQLLINRITQEVDSIHCNDINLLETFLKKYRNVLHPTHYLCLGVKLSLSQLYGKIDGFLIHELNDEMLERKHDICKEIIEIFDIIEPGYTRLRGVTLYEMHAPLMILLTRQVEMHQQSFSKSELRARLRVVARCLREASVILGCEPRTSPEGVMGLAADEALLKIKDWEEIVGKL